VLFLGQEIVAQQSMRLWLMEHLKMSSTPMLIMRAWLVTDVLVVALFKLAPGAKALPKDHAKLGLVVALAVRTGLFWTPIASLFHVVI
jgi:hypothetical protein